MSTIKSSAEDLTVTSDGVGKHTLIQDNGVTKLATTTTGIEVTGTIALNDGINNVGIGTGALSSPLLTGSSNTANGVSALLSNTEGANNTSNGVSALRESTTGNDNTASGTGSLRDNITGNSNTASGSSALLLNTSGDSNTAYGQAAGLNAILSNNTYLGSYRGTPTDSDQITLSAGTTPYQTISAPVAKGGVPVMHLVVSTDEETGEILDQVRVVDEHLMRDKIATAIEPLLSKIEELSIKLKTLEERKK